MNPVMFSHWNLSFLPCETNNWRNIIFSSIFPSFPPPPDMDSVLGSEQTWGELGLCPFHSRFCFDDDAMCCRILWECARLFCDCRAKKAVIMTSIVIDWNGAHSLKWFCLLGSLFPPPSSSLSSFISSSSIRPFLLQCSRVSYAIRKLALPCE